MHHFISGCGDKGIEKIKKIEEENGLILVAYQESEYDYDKLPEKELGVRIIALKKK